MTLRPVILVLLLAAYACGRGDAPVPTVRIAEPADGAVLDGPDVLVRLEAANVEIVPAVDQRPGTGHHHLFLNRELTPMTDTIPAGVTGIVHLGQGQTEFRYTDLAPGDYTLIALVADWDHIPLKPQANDTVTFTVR